jgi:tRNA(Arg) A34 adenosine deaminase TadA
MTVAQGPGARGLPLADDVLRGGWDRALRLAWEAFRARTTPVGAVVVDGRGAILAEGRGRRYDTMAPAGQLAGTHIAHAEVNVLSRLSAERDWEDAFLLTSLEPCTMCHGAAVQSTVAGFAFAGRDPYGGTAALRFDTPQARRRGLVISGPLPGPLGALAEMLHVAFLTSRGRHVLDAQRAAMPDITAYTEDVLVNLEDAACRDAYDRAMDLASAAPRHLPEA